MVLGRGGDGQPLAVDGRQLAGLANPLSIAAAILIGFLGAANWLPWLSFFHHVAFNATDFDAVHARLESQNVPVHVNVVPGIGLRQLFVFDPNGVKVEINIPA